MDLEYVPNVAHCTICSCIAKFNIIQNHKLASDAKLLSIKFIYERRVKSRDSHNIRPISQYFIKQIKCNFKISAFMIMAKQNTKKIKNAYHRIQIRHKCYCFLSYNFKLIV